MVSLVCRIAVYLRLRTTEYLTASNVIWKAMCTADVAMVLTFGLPVEP